MRRAKVDANQPGLVRLLRQCGCFVSDVHSLDVGYDLVVARGYNVALVEVKDGSKSPSARKLTDTEEETRMRCQGAARYIVVETEADAIALIDSLRGDY